MYGCLAGVAAAATLAWLSPTVAVTITGLVLLGFFLGPVFPTTMAIVPIAQRLGVWTLLPYMLTLAALQFAVWRPLARRISAPKPADPVFRPRSDMALCGR